MKAEDFGVVVHLIFQLPHLTTAVIPECLHALVHIAPESNSATGKTSMDYASYVHNWNSEVKLIMRSLQPTPPAGGAIGFGNESNAVRIGVPEVNNKTEGPAWC